MAGAKAAVAPVQGANCGQSGRWTRRERQEQERLRQEAEEQAAAQKAGGWLSRFRT
ncbi:hypothetical protein [Streptomyces sp. Ru62]|uniref:hypothetical protein n=1 Tax=Streptomyces sp. Ru62 TaxID=2080745 RepID=UPI0015E43B90|nr:hypothetical protein [Streptomyces sp. Ru62]